MKENDCFICGTALALREGRAFCTNDDCSSGGLFLRCGYCRAYSFSIHPDQMACANPDCRMHDISRAFCQDCSKTSRISHQDRTVCINRNCRSNGKAVSLCFFCGKRAFLELPDVMFCTKGDCPYLLRRMEVCYHCHDRTHEIERKSCQNAQCSYHGVAIQPCPECRERSGVTEKGHEYAGMCLNPACRLFHRSASSPPSSVDMEPEPATLGSEAARSDPKLEDDIETEPGTDLSGSVADEGQDGPQTEVIPARAPTPTGFPQRHHGDDFSIPLPEALTRPKEPPTRITPSGRLAPAAPPELPELPELEDPTRTAFRFLQERFLKDGSEASHPLYFLIGLSGSGKTTFLAALGEILAHRGFRYHFPWTGVDVPRLEVEPDTPPEVRRRVRDLVYEFAPEQLSTFMGKGQWTNPSPVRPDSGEACTQFLLTQINRGGTAIAQVLAVEAGGSEYDETLRSLRKRLELRVGEDAAQEAIVDLLGLSRGIVVLLDPENEENSEVFLDFFRLLGEAVAPRAVEQFQAEVKRRLLEGSGAGEEAKGIDALIVELLRDGAHVEGASRGRGQPSSNRPDLRRRIQEAIDEVRGDLGLSPDLLLSARPLPGQRGTETPFRDLKDLAFVITKADMYPIISPPAHYPDQRLPKCRPGIAALDGYLKILGGGVRFYNSSATGYSILRDTLYYPGKENTLTPINIAEPLFDMLDCG